MTLGAGTERLRAKLSAKIDGVLDNYGQTVAIHRPGQPDTQHRAYLYQEDKAGAAKAVATEYAVPQWKGIFKFDAPIGPDAGHFTVSDSQGRVYVPNADSNDGGTQGVAWFASLLPLPERVKLEGLAFTVADGSTKDPRTGNPVPQFKTLPPIPVRLYASTDPQIRDMSGADSAEVVLVGRWGSLLTPLLKPDNVGWGSTATLVLDGRQGTLTLKLPYPDPDTAQERHFGARFVGVWRAK